MGNRISGRSRSGGSRRGSSRRSRNARAPQKLVRVLFIPDCHVPAHSKYAWRLLLKVAKVLKPDIIVILGDFADADSLLGHPRTRPSANDLESDVSAVNAALNELDSLGAGRKIYVEGNHESRLDRFLMEKAPALFRSLKWPKLLRLHERGWEWVPYRKSSRIGKLHITHDTGSAGLNAHRSSAKAFGGSSVIGHTHRMAYEVTGRFDSTPYLACMLGWLGDPEEAASYLHVAKASEWVHGFGLGYLEPGTGVVHLQPIPIVNGKCVVNGVLYE